MKKANIAYTRDNLSKLIAYVREGNSILITDRQQPVARLEPISDGYAAPEHPASNLIRRGLVRPPQKRRDLTSLQENLPLSQGDIVAALECERGDRL